MYHLHTFRHISYVYPYIFLTKQGNTSTIEAPFFGADLVEWSRAINIRLRYYFCSASMM